MISGNKNNNIFGIRLIQKQIYFQELDIDFAPSYTFPYKMCIGELNTNVGFANMEEQNTCVKIMWLFDGNLAYLEEA